MADAIMNLRSILVTTTGRPQPGGEYVLRHGRRKPKRSRGGK